MGGVFIVFEPASCEAGSAIGWGSLGFGRGPGCIWAHDVVFESSRRHASPNGYSLWGEFPRT